MRRRELCGVACGTLGAFVGRNTDVRGYWGMGVLCRFATEQEVSTVEIDLLAQRMWPASHDFSGVIAGGRARLFRHMQAASLPEGWLREAKIRLSFEPTTRPHAASHRFRCVVTLVDDRGRVFERDAEGWCWPHDPRRESRSARFRGERGAAP